VQGKNHRGENENIFYPLFGAHGYQQIFNHHFVIIPMTGFYLQLKNETADHPPELTAGRRLDGTGADGV
jgi:hypothetical protein